MSQYDHCFWLGDLNYRVDLQQLDGVERSEAEHREEVVAIIGRGDFTALQVPSRAWSVEH